MMVLCSPLCLCRYWEAVLELLWPRFELILEMNIQSIRNTDPQKLGVLDTRPHYVCTHTDHKSVFTRSLNHVPNHIICNNPHTGVHMMKCRSLLIIGQIR